MNTQNSWTLREILIVAAIGATFGFLYLGWVQVWLISQALFGSVTMDASGSGQLTDADAPTFKKRFYRTKD